MYRINPTFFNDTVISATDLNILRQNYLTLDGISRRPPPAFQYRYGQPAENDDEQNNLIWSGGYTHVESIDTLTIQTRSVDLEPSTELRVYLDGVLVDTLAVTSGLQSFDVAVPPAPHKSVVRIELRIYNAAEPDDWGYIQIVHMWFSPVETGESYPAAPTFDTSPSIGAMRGLVNACNLIMRQVALRVDPLFQSVTRAPGPYNPAPIWDASLRGSITIGIDPTTLTAVGVMLNELVADHVIQLYINGVLSDSEVIPSTLGEHTWGLTHDVTSADPGDIIEYEVRCVNTTPDAPLSGRFTVLDVSTDATGAVDDAIPEFEILGDYPYGPSGTEGTLATHLNRLRNRLAEIYNRIMSNPAFTQQVPFSARFHDSPEQFINYERRFVAFTRGRKGEALLVRGSGVNLTYGPGKFLDADTANDYGDVQFENARSVQVIEGGPEQTVRFYYPRVIPMGTPYNLRGVDIFYAGDEYGVSIGQ